jgi:hypothetical protein
MWGQSHVLIGNKRKLLLCLSCHYRNVCISHRISQNIVCELLICGHLFDLNTFWYYVIDCVFKILLFFFCRTPPPPQKCFFLGKFFMSVLPWIVLEERLQVVHEWRINESWVCVNSGPDLPDTVVGIWKIGIQNMLTNFMEWDPWEGMEP